MAVVVFVFSGLQPAYCFTKLMAVLSCLQVTRTTFTVLLN